MKKYAWWIIAVFVGWILAACSNSNEKFFNDTASLYFDLTGADVDSIVYSFAKTTATEHTIEIPVEIAGYKTDYDRHYKVVIDESTTTARKDLHYKTLQDEYTLPAGSFTTKLPLVVYATDRLLDSVEVCIGLKIEPTGDFSNQTQNRQQAKVHISNMLQKPAQWDGALGPKYFGVYSRVKYKLILQECRVDEIPRYNSNNRHMLKGMGLTMQNYFRDNYPVYDENNQVIDYTWKITY